MPRKPIDAELKQKALNALKENVAKSGKPELRKVAEAVGVKEATLRVWWAKVGAPGPKKRKRSTRSAAKQSKSPAAMRKLEKVIANIDAELATIRELFATYRAGLLERLKVE